MPRLFIVAPSAKIIEREKLLNFNGQTRPRWHRSCFLFSQTEAGCGGRSARRAGRRDLIEAAGEAGR